MALSVPRWARLALSLLVVAGLVAGLVVEALAGAVTNVSVTKVPGSGVQLWVHSTGPLQYSVKKVDDRTWDYRSIVLDVWPASIVAGKEPKKVLPIQEGLVAQVRVRQIGNNTVRCYLDVIYWPAKWKVLRSGNSVGLWVDAYHEAPSK
ncbi:MAG TPA: hypothetical protein VNO81_05800 [Candidatus Nitrosotenuis sp.]|jgi:hypothetical protein|nr:hypothetical protein [Candidatus Nitrosotenuis sp.]